MPFDPTLPVNNSKVRASELRDQFNGLKALIDAVQAITAAQVDSTSTLPAGNAAQVSVSVVGNTLHFSFQIPEGPPGSAGAPGEVSSGDMANAISLSIQGTSNNSNAVGQMSIAADSSYNPSQLQQVMDKVDELILALRR